MAAESASITVAGLADCAELAALLGELLHEIMAGVGSREFEFCLEETQARAEDFLRRGVYFPFIARQDGVAVGFLGLYESHALYAEGDFGTIAELYVRPAYRSRGIGVALLAEARALGAVRGWKRLEVTAPPLPVFQRTLAFYERHGFAVAGGRKLKTLL
jgi:GNAT superfamily N-acetyltransferase